MNYQSRRATRIFVAEFVRIRADRRVPPKISRFHLRGIRHARILRDVPSGTARVQTLIDSPILSDYDLPFLLPDLISAKQLSGDKRLPVKSAFPPQFAAMLPSHLKVLDLAAFLWQDASTDRNNFKICSPCDTPNGKEIEKLFDTFRRSPATGLAGVGPRTLHYSFSRVQVVQRPLNHPGERGGGRLANSLNFSSRISQQVNVL
ncbi:MAG: hypothetical protein JWM11_4064 [Planctomycetaceae bacterium]|nr:hypothetical protein [Planctomycetaceae bacterium]